jgi:hypothetical protein
MFGGGGKGKGKGKKSEAKKTPKGPTKKELYERAKALGIVGRSKMTCEELAKAVKSKRKSSKS